MEEYSHLLKHVFISVGGIQQELGQKSPDNKLVAVLIILGGQSPNQATLIGDCWLTVGRLWLAEEEWLMWLIK